MSYIELKDLSYKYPMGKKYALSGVNLILKKGGVTAIIGENGCGKTTICNALRGFIPHFYNGDLCGELLIEGKDIRKWSTGRLAENIGFVFQNPFIQISGVKDTVYEEVAFGLENLGIQVDIINEKVQQVIKLLGIGYLQDKNPYELSGGQQQRVALASIIAMDQDVLIFDEPTSQLDPKGTEEVFKIIEIMKQKGKTIIIVEHKMELIAEYADYVVLMQNGQIAMQGKTKDILSDEQAMNYGVSLPQYALLGIKMKEKNLNLQQIPLSENESVTALQRWLAIKEVKA